MYTYQCPTHGKFDALVKISARNDGQPCTVCAAICRRHGVEARSRLMRTARNVGFHMFGVEARSITNPRAVFRLDLNSLTQEQREFFARYAEALNTFLDDADPDAAALNAFCDEWLSKAEAARRSL